MGMQNKKNIATYVFGKRKVEEADGLGGGGRSAAEVTLMQVQSLLHNFANSQASHTTTTITNTTVHPTTPGQLTSDSF